MDQSHGTICLTPERTPPTGATEVRVRPGGPTLAYADLDRLVSELKRQIACTPEADVTIDFCEIEHVAAPWTPVFARLIEFARQISGRCTLASLHGEPADMAAVLKVDHLSALDLNIDMGPPPD